MANKLWKATERKIATIMGGRRVPVSGRQRGDSPDVEHPDFSIEVKSWNNIPEWLFDAIDQAKKSKKEGQIPVVILHKNGKRHDSDLAIFELSGIMKLYGEILELRKQFENLSEKYSDVQEYLQNMEELSE